MTPEEWLAVSLVAYFTVGCWVMNALKRPEDDDSLFIILWLIWPVAVVGELILRGMARAAIRRDRKKFLAEGEEPPSWVGE